MDEPPRDAVNHPPDLCPLCGRGNGCAAASGEPTCWCFDATISEEALARIPPDLVGVACLCPDCAAGLVPSPCLDVCEVDATAGTCRGCHRTLDEIAAWPTMGDEEKRAVLARLAERRRQIFSDDRRT
jgi:predicted Fe-S protein YdhL (DUF1289 family)